VVIVEPVFVGFLPGFFIIVIEQGDWIRSSINSDIMPRTFPATIAAQIWNASRSTVC
jgi:hypothetical protein